MIYPDYYYDSVFEIPYERLHQQNIRGLIFDVDNTLVPYDTPRPPAKITALIRRLQRMGFQIALSSNNNNGRVELFNESLKLVCVSNALKPLPSAVNRAIQEMGVTRETTAIIGDQLFTDIWCGKNAKITTILVKPSSKKDVLPVRLKRIFEKPILNAYLKNGKRKYL